MAWLGVLDSTHNNKRRRAESVTCSHNNNVKKCLLEVPGVTGAFLNFFATPTNGSGKKTTTEAVVAVRPLGTADPAVPDGTEGENNANCVTKSQQHNTDRLALDTTAVRTCRLAWSWSKLNNTTTTKTRLDLGWEGSHCNVHVFNCVAACVDVGGHQFVVVEYLTSSPVNDTHRHYKREYFIYKLFM